MARADYADFADSSSRTHYVGGLSVPDTEAGPPFPGGTMSSGRGPGCGAGVVSIAPTLSLTEALSKGDGTQLRRVSKTFPGSPFHMCKMPPMESVVTPPHKVNSQNQGFFTIFHM